METFATNFSNRLDEFENIFTTYSLSNAGYEYDEGVPIQIMILSNDRYMKKIYKWEDRIIMVMEYDEKGVFVKPLKHYKDEEED